MASNVTMDPGSGGSTVVTKQISHDGDTAQLPGSFIMGITGTEDSYTAGAINGDATNGLDVDVTRVSGTVTVTGAGGSFPVTDSSGSLTVDAPVATPVFVRLSDGSAAITTLAVSLASVPSHAVTNAGTFVVQVDGTALTRLTDIETNTDSGALVGNGAAASAQRVTIANDSTGTVALTTSSATIGKLAANSGVDIGDVDVTSVSGNVTVVQSTASNLNATVVGTGTFVVQATCTNAGTFAVQATCTNAGTFAVQVDGNALTALQLIDNIVHVDDAGFTLGSHSGVMMMGFAGTQSVDANDAAALACTTAGALHVSDAGGSLTVDNAGTFAVQATCTNAGTFAVQVDGAALTALQLIDNPVLVDDAGFSPATSSVMMAGFEADEGSTDSVDEGDAGAARMTLDRKLIVTAQPHTAGGCSIFRTLDLDETEEDVKTSAGQVYGIYAFNTTNAIIYLKFYNLTAANTTVGASTPVMTLGVPGNNDTDGGGFVLTMPVGIAFDTAICVAATTGIADADTGAPGGNALLVNILYK